MKRFSVALVSALLLTSTASISYAHTNSPIPERDSSSVSLFEYATRIPKREKVFNLDLIMHAGFNTDFLSGKLDEAAFRFRDVKIDITGEVNDRLFYWYRQTLNGGYEGQALENLNESIDYAYIGYKLNERLTLTAGKQDVCYGGFEYDKNPWHIYEYSDMNEYVLCYLTGIGLKYQLDEAQDIRLQVMNNRVGLMEDTYGRLPEGFKKPKVPLFYTLNWNGSFLDELIGLRYSVSATEQARGKYMYGIFGGQSLEAGPIYAFFDVMYVRGELDPLGLLTELTRTEASGEEEAESPVRVRNTDYLSLVGEIQYRFHPKWQLFAKGMYESASVYKAYDTYGKGKYRTAWGYQGGLEFYPMADDNLRIFLIALGRKYSLTERAKALGGSLEDTVRLSVGFIYKLPLF